MACGEFSLIARYFDRVRTSRLDVETGIGDDCALLNIPEKQTLAISTDTLVAGNHFLPDIDPTDLAWKALAVNLSDLAAMGALVECTQPVTPAAVVIEAFACTLPPAYVAALASTAPPVLWLNLELSSLYLGLSWAALGLVWLAVRTARFRQPLPEAAL